MQTNPICCLIFPLHILKYEAMQYLTLPFISLERLHSLRSTLILIFLGQFDFYSCIIFIITFCSGCSVKVIIVKNYSLKT